MLLPAHTFPPGVIETEGGALPVTVTSMLSVEEIPQLSEAVQTYIEVAEGETTVVWPRLPPGDQLNRYGPTP